MGMQALWESNVSICCKIESLLAYSHTGMIRATVGSTGSTATLDYSNGKGCSSACDDD
jgi:hypothetical protein